MRDRNPGAVPLPGRGKADKGLLRRFLVKVTGLSRAQVTRLLHQRRTNGTINDRRGPHHPFPTPLHQGRHRAATPSGACATATRGSTCWCCWRPSRPTPTWLCASWSTPLCSIQELARNRALEPDGRPPVPPVPPAVLYNRRGALAGVARHGRADRRVRHGGRTVRRPRRPWRSSHAPPDVERFRPAGDARNCQDRPGAAPGGRRAPPRRPLPPHRPTPAHGPPPRPRRRRLLE